MILGLIFSKDRGLQLEACLNSLGRHVQDMEAIHLVVLYKESSGRFRRQYELLARRFDGSVQFLHEEHFRRQVLEILGSATMSSREAGKAVSSDHSWRSAVEQQSADSGTTDSVLFLVDDTLFVSPLRLRSAQTTLESNPRALGLSLRLGRNTTYCYTLSRPQKLPRFQDAGDSMLKYDWTRADGDFGYPLEISSSLYRLPEITPLISRLPFADPNTLESQLSLHARRLARERPWLICPDQSIAFSAPINRVQEVFENRASAKPGWSTEALGDVFDSGLRVDVAAWDGFVPSSCHQEVELTFEPRPA